MQVKFGLECKISILRYAHTLAGFQPKKKKTFRMPYYPKYLFRMEREKELMS